MPVLTLSALRYSHPDTTPVFDGLTVTLPPGLTGLVGANGSGKSTLIALIAGRLVPTGGTIALSGTLGQMPQAPDPGLPVAALFDCAEDIARRRCQHHRRLRLTGFHREGHEGR